MCSRFQLLLAFILCNETGFNCPLPSVQIMPISFIHFILFGKRGFCAF